MVHKAFLMCYCGELSTQVSLLIFPIKIKNVPRIHRPLSRHLFFKLEVLCAPAAKQCLSLSLLRAHTPAGRLSYNLGLRTPKSCFPSECGSLAVVNHPGASSLQNYNLDAR